MSEDESAALQTMAARVTYGWCMVPVEARIGHAMVHVAVAQEPPVRRPADDRVRAAEQIQLGDTVMVGLAFDV